MWVEVARVAAEEIQPSQGKQRQVYSWRLAPSEFSAGAAPTRDKRRRNVRRADAGDPMTDDES